MFIKEIIFIIILMIFLRLSLRKTKIYRYISCNSKKHMIRVKCVENRLSKRKILTLEIPDKIKITILFYNCETITFKDYMVVHLDGKFWKSKRCSLDEELQKLIEFSTSFEQEEIYKVPDLIDQIEKDVRSKHEL